MNDDSPQQPQPQQQQPVEQADAAKTVGVVVVERDPSHNADGDIIGGETVSLADAYNYGEENPHYRDRFTDRLADRIFTAVWFIIFLFVVVIAVASIGQSSMLQIPVSIALFVVFGIPLALLGYLNKMCSQNRTDEDVSMIPTVLMIRNFLTAFLAAGTIVPIASSMVAGVLTFPFRSEQVALTVMAVIWVVVSELIKLHCVQTRDSRSKVRRAVDYIYLQMATALGFAALECLFISRFMNVAARCKRDYCSYEDQMDVNQPRQTTLTCWWICASVIQAVAHCLSTYFLGMAVSHRDLVLIRELESQLTRQPQQQQQEQVEQQQQEQPDSTTASSIQNATVAETPEPTSKFAPLKRPFFTCVVTRLAVMSILLLLAISRADLIAFWLALPVALIPLLFLFKAVIEFQVTKLPVSYLVSTGYLSLRGWIPLPNLHDSDEESEDVHTASSSRATAAASTTGMVVVVGGVVEAATGHGQHQQVNQEAEKTGNDDFVVQERPTGYV